MHIASHTQRRPQMRLCVQTNVSGLWKEYIHQFIDIGIILSLLASLASFAEENLFIFKKSSLAI